jgi:hypothetical protein
MRTFSPTLVWTAVSIALKLARVVRSVQHVKGSLSITSGGVKNVSLGTTLTDSARAVMWQNMFGGSKFNAASSGSFAVDEGWYVSSTTQASISVTYTGGSDSLYYNFWVVEFY